MLAFPNAKRTQMIPLFDFINFIKENKLTWTEQSLRVLI